MKRSSCGRPACGENFTAGHQQYPAGMHNPYTVLNKHLDGIRGHRHDAYNQRPVHQHPRGLDRYHRSGADLKPEDIAEAERAQWYTALGADHTETFNPEMMHDIQADSMQYHTTSPALDYDTYVTDLVIDPRTRDNHRKWVEEMKPWSGTAMKVDDLDMENYVEFTGLRRPQAVVQHNPHQLTEIDSDDLAKNAKFNFKG